MRVRLSILREYVQTHYETLLVEGRVEDAREKYPEMEDEAFDYLVANQPAGSNNKYLLWCCKQADALLRNDPDPQGLRIVIDAVRLFDGNKQRLEKKDLNQYKDTAEVEAAIDKLGTSKAQQAKQARADTDVIYNDDRFMVVRPHTTEASCKYGVGTRWCIAATQSRNYFNQYSTSNNKFYFIIDKSAQPNDANAKLAVVILDPVTDESEARIQVFNTPDHQVGLRTAIRHCGDKWPAIWAKIKEHVGANPITREVEEARRSVEEHVKALLKGEKVSKEGMEKIAKDATLTTPIILGLIKRMQEYTGPADYTDPRSGIIARLSERASQLTPEGALALIKYVSTTKPAGDSYWSGRYHLEALMKNSPLTPDAFRELVRTSNNDSVLGLIISNPNCPADIIDMLAARISELRDNELKKNVWRALIKRGTISPEQMRTAMRGDTNGYGSLAYEVLHYPDMSARLTPELLRLVPVHSASDLKQFLQLPNVPPDMIADLISANWNKMKKQDLYELLRSINLPTEMIERIWTDKDQHIRTALLQNPAIGAENAAKFAGSRNSAYRFAVAHNPILPAESLQTLAGDESASTRGAVASNPNTPADTLKKLGGDNATVVRANVASNAKTPRNVLDALKKDTDDFVRKSARKTLKSLETTETFVRMMLGMHGLMTEELADDDSPDTMTPHWTEIPLNSVTTAEWVSIYLLQNNGHATREEIQESFQLWNPQHDTTRYSRSRYGGRRRAVTVRAKDVWQVLKSEEGYGDSSARTISASGKGWWWSPPGINKGAVFRLTPAGAAAALESLQKIRAKYTRQWTTRERPEVKTSAPPRELAPQAAPNGAAGAANAPPAAAAAGPAAARGPKTTYKIYGRFKGHPVATRLKGQAYVGPANTQFSAGEQAVIAKTDDGKLSVKKADSDHTQTWDPIDG